MVDRTFLTISAEECMIEYKLVIDHSNQKFNSAKILAKNEDFGSAIALLIVSNEELIKALILCLDGIGFEFRKIKGIKSFFNNHKLRYLLAFILSIISIVSKDLLNLFMNVKDNPKRILKFLNDQSKIELILKNYLVKKSEFLQKEVDFFSKFDKSRQIGLYSDYQENQIITREYYVEYYSKIKTLKSTILLIIESMQSIEMEEHINQIKKQFKNQNFYKKIEELVKKINSPNFNSYKDLSQAFIKFHTELKGEKI